MKKLLFAFLFCSTVAHAQWYVGIKLMGMSIHTDKGLNCGMYKCTVGKKHRVAFHLGAAVTVEYMINDWLSVKADQALFRDCAGKLAGMSMFNFRYTLNLQHAGNVSAGIGPFFYYRRSWFDLPQYQDDGYFKLSPNQKWQRKFVWYGGEIEYNYPINDQLDWSTNILPGIPVVIAVASGVRSRL